MLKHVYKAILLVAVFIGALYYFGQNIRQVIFHMDDTTVMSEASFPLVTLGVQENTINLLHGYLSSLDASVVRESITPLDQTQSFFVYIEEKESTVKKVNYELRNTYDNGLIESGSYSALEKQKERKVAKIKINESLETGKEYALKITCVTAESKKINYYTRIIKSLSYPVKEQLDFVMQFHEKLFDKKKIDEIAEYLEYDRSQDNTDLAHVTIASDRELLSFGKLNPNIITDVIPTIKEVSSDIASIQLSYYIQGETGDGKEQYQVTEFYRVKYTPARMYLLDYDRTMEAQFNIGHMSLGNGAFKIGITNDPNLPIYSDGGSQNLSFVRNRELWYYNVEHNQAVRVFSFREDTSDNIRDVYDQHDIKVLTMNVEGTMDFMVYGYMNRGAYEGRVGILLYRYYPSDQRIEELVYIPVNVPYQILKEQIGNFSYVNYNDVFYFMLENTLYSYNRITKSLQQLANNIGEEDYVFSKEKGFVAWQTKEDGLAKTITILELATEKRKIISAKKGENLRLLGLIEHDIIYGECRDKDTYTTVDGKQMIPLYEIYIIKNDGTVRKNYKKKNYYVIDATVKDNVIELKRMKKENKRFLEAKDDYILNQVVNRTSIVSVTSRVTDQAMKEYYLTFVKDLQLKKKPSVVTTANTIIKEETTLRIEPQPLKECYYVYAYGEVQGKYSSAGDAIVLADSMVGVVINQNQQMVWKRGTRASRVEIDIENKRYVSDTVDSYDACARMMQQTKKRPGSTQAGVDKPELIKQLERQIGAVVVNATGCDLTQALYYVAMGRPVIAAKDRYNVVLIVGYDSNSIRVIDPSTRVTSRMSLKNASELFEAAGNVYLSYIE